MNPESPSKPALLLLPNLLGDHKHHAPFLPASVDKAVASIDGLIAESLTEGRRYLGRFATKKPPNEIPIALLNEHTADDELDFLLEPIRSGERWGLVSDGGLPCIADPGSKLVRRARQSGVIVQAFVGPSSLILALMLSGFPAQRFNFAGYLDKDPKKRATEIKSYEKKAKAEDSTQMFIEAPYRNTHVLDSFLNVLQNDTLLCAAWELTSPNQGVIAQTVEMWKKSPLPNLDKRSTIFLISAS